MNLRKEISALQRRNDEIIQENIFMKKLVDKNKKEKEAQKQKNKLQI